MIAIHLKVEHQQGVIPHYSEAFGNWEVNTPVTSDEYERFCNELDKAKKMARQIYKTTNGFNCEEETNG